MGNAVKALAVTALALGTAVQAKQVSPPPVIIAPPPPLPPPPPAPPLPDGAVPARPYTNPGNWVTSNDYPTRALREERSGTTSFRLTVGPDGRPVACDITDSSGSADLDSTACALLMRRSRFSPALDAEGNPTVGTWASRFRWTIPEPEIFEHEKHPLPGLSVITFTVDRLGFAKDCRLVSGADPETFLYFVMPCAGDQKFPIYTDAKGNAVERRVRITIGVTLPGTQPAAPRKKRR